MNYYCVQSTQFFMTRIIHSIFKLHPEGRNMFNQKNKQMKQPYGNMSTERGHPMGWGGSCRVAWVMQGWSGSYRGGLGHAGVGWVIQG